MNQQRITVHDAARQLGISEDAVRMRVKRGTLEAEREAGRLYVLLDSVPTTDPTPRTDDRTEELITELRDRVRSLEHQLDQERAARTEERRRADTVIAQLSAATAEQARTIRAIEAPAPPESPEPREPGPHRVRPERAEPVEPVDPTREEPERVQPERVEPERAEPRESPVTAANEQQGRGPIPNAGGPQEPVERVSWWRRMFGS